MAKGVTKAALAPTANASITPQGPQSPAATPTAILGDYGMREWAGCIREEYLKELIGRNGQRIFRQIRDSEPIIGGIFFIIEQLLKGVQWTAEAAGPEPAEQKKADFLQENLAGMATPWDDFISEVLTLMTFGWSLFEEVYRVDGNGAWVWDRWAPRAQDTLLHWDFDINGDVIAFVQMPWNASRRTSPIVIPADKFLLFRTVSNKNNPEGRSMLRNVYRPWYQKTNLESIEAIGLERDLAGLPVIRVPASYMTPTATDDQKQTVDALERTGRNLRLDQQSVVILPSNVYEGTDKYQFDISLLSNQSRRAVDTNASIVRYRQEMAMVFIADFLLLGHEKVGSFALSSDKTDLFAIGIGGLLKMIAGPINLVAIPRLMKLNGMEPPYPILRAGDIEKEDVKALVESLEKLAGIGMELFPDPTLDASMRDKLGLPPRDEQSLREVGDDQDQETDNPGEQDDNPEEDQGESGQGTRAGGDGGGNAKKPSPDEDPGA